MQRSQNNTMSQRSKETNCDDDDEVQHQPKKRKIVNDEADDVFDDQIEEEEFQECCGQEEDEAYQDEDIMQQYISHSQALVAEDEDMIQAQLSPAHSSVSSTAESVSVSSSTSATATTSPNQVSNQDSSIPVFLINDPVRAGNASTKLYYEYKYQNMVNPHGAASDTILQTCLRLIFSTEEIENQLGMFLNRWVRDQSVPQRDKDVFGDVNPIERIFNNYRPALDDFITKSHKIWSEKYDSSDDIDPHLLQNSVYDIALAKFPMEIYTIITSGIRQEIRDFFILTEQVKLWWTLYNVVVKTTPIGKNMDTVLNQAYHGFLKIPETINSGDHDSLINVWCTMISQISKQIHSYSQYIQLMISLRFENPHTMLINFGLATQESTLSNSSEIAIAGFIDHVRFMAAPYTTALEFQKILDFPDGMFYLLNRISSDTLMRSDIAQLNSAAADQAESMLANVLQMSEDIQNTGLLAINLNGSSMNVHMGVNGRGRARGRGRGRGRGGARGGRGGGGDSSQGDHDDPLDMQVHDQNIGNSAGGSGNNQPPILSGINANKTDSQLTIGWLYQCIIMSCFLKGWKFKISDSSSLLSSHSRGRGRGGGSSSSSHNCTSWMVYHPLVLSNGTVTNYYIPHPSKIASDNASTQICNELEQSYNADSTIASNYVPNLSPSEILTFGDHINSFTASCSRVYSLSPVIVQGLQTRLNLSGPHEGLLQIMDFHRQVYCFKDGAFDLSRYMVVPHNTIVDRSVYPKGIPPAFHFIDRNIIDIHKSSMDQFFMPQLKKLWKFVVDEVKNDHATTTTANNSNHQPTLLRKKKTELKAVFTNDPSSENIYTYFNKMRIYKDTSTSRQPQTPELQEKEWIHPTVFADIGTYMHPLGVIQYLKKHFIPDFRKWVLNTLTEQDKWILLQLELKGPNYVEMINPENTDQAEDESDEAVANAAFVELNPANTQVLDTWLYFMIVCALIGKHFYPRLDANHRITRYLFCLGQAGYGKTSFVESIADMFPSEFVATTTAAKDEETFGAGKYLNAQFICISEGGKTPFSEASFFNKWITEKSLNVSIKHLDQVKVSPQGTMMSAQNAAMEWPNVDPATLQGVVRRQFFMSCFGAPKPNNNIGELYKSQQNIAMVRFTLCNSMLAKIAKDAFINAIPKHQTMLEKWVPSFTIPKDFFNQWFTYAQGAFLLMEDLIAIVRHIQQNVHNLSIENCKNYLENQSGVEKIISSTEFAFTYTSQVRAKWDHSSRVYSIQTYEFGPNKPAFRGYSGIKFNKAIVKEMVQAISNDFDLCPNDYNTIPLNTNYYFS